MLETAVALGFGHLVADFLLQSDAMVAHKRRPGYFLLHILIVVALSWAALGYPPAWPLLGLIAGSHAAIDQIKLRWAGPGLTAFLLDQGAHLAAIAAAAALWPQTWSDGAWAAPATLHALPWLARLPEAYAAAAGLVATVWAGGYAVGALMRDMAADIPKGLPRGGLMIGRLERLMILMMILMGQPAGIGFLITAKSILRFGEVTGHQDDATTRLISEYVIIGTLASFAWALVTATATAALIEQLARGS